MLHQKNAFRGDSVPLKRHPHIIDGSPTGEGRFKVSDPQVPASVVTGGEPCKPCHILIRVFQPLTD